MWSPYTESSLHLKFIFTFKTKLTQIFILTHSCVPTCNPIVNTVPALPAFHPDRRVTPPIGTNLCILHGGSAPLGSLPRILPNLHPSSSSGPNSRRVLSSPRVSCSPGIPSSLAVPHPCSWICTASSVLIRIPTLTCSSTLKLKPHLPLQFHLYQLLHSHPQLVCVRLIPVQTFISHLPSYHYQEIDPYLKSQSYLTSCPHLEFCAYLESHHHLKDEKILIMCDQEPQTV